MISPAELITGVSVIGALLLIGAIVFAESGLLIGLVLPGDTLLFTAGFFAAQGELPLAWVLVVIFVGAVLGDNLGYFIGDKTGPKIFRRNEGIFFRQDYAERAQRFYNQHGGKTITVARFIPYVRTFAPLVAGVAHMHRPRFIVFNLLGAFLWTLTFVLLGYWLGIEVAEQIEGYLVPVFIGGLLFIFGPAILYFIRSRRFRHYVTTRLRAFWDAITTPFRFR